VFVLLVDYHAAEFEKGNTKFLGIKWGGKLISFWNRKNYPKQSAKRPADKPAKVTADRV